MEEALENLPFPTAFVRAGSFLENYIYGLNSGGTTGWFDTYLTPTDRSIPMIATEDIGKEIAHLLVGGWSGNKIVELGSPVSPDDLAGALSLVLNRPVQARSIPRANWTASLEALGLPPGSTGSYEEMFDGWNSGWIDFGVPGTQSVPATVTPAQFFEKTRKVQEATS